MLQQYEQVREALEKSQDEVNILQQDLTHERMQGRRKHLRLIDDLTKALQTRDAALAALKRLEKYCIDHGLDVKGMTIYEVIN